ncbi:MAG: hypothetical protein KTR24_16240 [Saprospiraceae bacterium]|nr:hypothetical protein [Saprospiraceae bacterium]
MKNTLLYIICLLSPLVYGQEIENDPQAKALLEQVERKIQALENVGYAYNLTIDPPEEEHYSVKGTFCQAGPQYHLDLENFTFICDGSSQWVVDKVGQEIQIHDYEEPSPDDLTDPQNLLKIHQNDNFRYRLYEPGSIEFIPKSRDFEYFRAVMKMNNSAEIKEVQLWSKDGTHYHLDILEHTYDKALPEGFFKLKPSDYPSFHVEDLRID